MRFLLLILGCFLAGPGDPELERLEDVLRGGDKWERITAVRGLARLGQEKAWGLVLDALADPAGEVADTAQWVLGQSDDPEVVERLLGREGLASREPVVRMRAAEALGRVGAPVEADDLVRGLKVREPETRRAVLQAVELLAGRGGLAGDPARRLAPAVRRATRDRDPRVRGEALQALVELDPGEARGLASRWLAKEDPAPRCAVLARAEELELTLDELARAAAADSIPVRTAAVDALVRRGTREACGVLVDRLEAEAELRLSWRIVAGLRRLSGRKDRRDPRPWRLWAQGLPEDWRAPAGSAPAGAEASVDRSSALAGLPILSERLCFLIDLSGSMWRSREGERSRKEVVDERLRACLEGLPETTEFNLIPFTAEALPWRPEVVDARPRHVEEAAAWFEACDARGAGDFWEAFQLALADPRVDTVVLLGDGEPTGGLRYVLDLLPSLVEAENLGRQVAVDSILVDAKGKTRRTWEEIARRTGGRSVVVDL